MNFYDMLKERADDEKIFLRVDDRTFTYKKFFETVNAAADKIDDNGSNVYIAADNFLDQAIQFFAVQALGRRPIILHHDNQMPSTTSRANADDAIGVLSSGSGGRPKILFRTFDSWASFFPIQNKIFSVNQNSAVFIHGSLSFTGNLNVLLATVSAGGSIVTSDKFSVRAWNDLIDGCSNMYLVPTKLNLIASSNRSIETVKTIFTGSQAVGDKLRAQLQKKFPNAGLILYYGASELNYITYKIVDGAIDANNVGRAFDGIAIDIINGLIYVNSPWGISGLKMPCTVGDAGHLNGEGELILEGRGDNFINKGGYKINSERIENILQSIEGIAQSAVLKIHDERRGDDFIAFVVPTVDQCLIEKKIRRCLKPVEQPAKIIFVDHIPLNDRGKVDRSRLIKSAAVADSLLADVGNRIGALVNVGE